MPLNKIHIIHAEASGSDRQTQQIIDKLTSRLGKVTDRIGKIMDEVAISAETSNAYWNSVNSRLRAEYAEARSIIKSWAENEIPKEYQSRLASTIRKLKSRVFDTQNPVDYKSFKDTNAVKQSMRALTTETLASFDVGLRSGEKTLLRLTSVTHQVLLSERAVNKAVAEGFFEQGSGSASKRRLRDELMKKALDGKYVTVVNKNGKPVQYGIDNYSELVARTKLMEASTQAVLDTAQTVGSDLVQVSVHNTLCAVCAQFEGKVFSLSSSDPDFPPLEDEPPYHPNCMHSLSITFREGMARDGTLEKYVDFSTGETEEHPTRAGWIPLAERKLT